MAKTRIISLLLLLSVAALPAPAVSANEAEATDPVALPRSVLMAAQGAVSGQKPAADAGSAPKGVWEEIKQGFDARFNVVLFGLVQKPIDLPELGRIRKPVEDGVNRQLGITQYQTELDLRPDFYLNYQRLELAFKPRFTGLWRKWRRGESEGDYEFYVQEWLARLRVLDSLFVSYGRENLQWGPSYLLSPSNPFIAVNGKNNPQLEVPGMDYGKVQWIPNSGWTLSYIVNANEGRVEPIEDFKRTYALKLDYTGKGYYVSLIPSFRERERDKFKIPGSVDVDVNRGGVRVGFFGGWTVSDALLLHTEGSISGDTGKPRVLVGASYTFALGPTLTVEYYRNQDGCPDDQVLSCLADVKPGFVKVGDPNLTFNPDGIFLRRNYLMLQYVQTRIRDKLNVTARWIRNLDDDANRFVSILEYALQKNSQLFLINSGRVLEDNKITDFRMLPKYSVMLGVSFTF